MKIGALAPWFGGKRTMAPTIVAQLGRHVSYWEPFCGSMAILLAKPRVRDESVNDLHKDLTNLAMCLQDEVTANDLYERTVRTLFHEDILVAARAELRKPWEFESPDPTRAYWYVVSSWMMMNGLAGTHQPGERRGIAARYSAKGGAAATRWCSVVDSMPFWHERLRGVQILSRDGFKIIDLIDDAPGTVIYADPPYFEKSARYVHDFDGDDHARLARLLARFKNARVVVSYYEHPRLAELYAGWTVVPCKVPKSMRNGSQRSKTGGVDAPEVLLINGEDLAGGLPLFD